MDKIKTIKVGAISKANRKSGEISVVFDNKSIILQDRLEQIFIEIDGGLVPFFVKEMGAVSPEYFRVVLQDYEAPDVAQRFVGCGVFLPADQLPDLSETDQMDLDAIVGFEVIDEVQGKLGVIAKVIESPHQILLQIMNDGKEILIPFVEAFLQEIDEDRRIIYFSLPEGLVDINQDN